MTPATVFRGACVGAVAVAGGCCWAGAVGGAIATAAPQDAQNRESARNLVPQLGQNVG